ncbi:MAG: methionine biosynthesis protein MetW [Pseudomonadota bacterium]
MTAPAPAIRRDLLEVAALIDPGARVLDVGCGDGALLDYLARSKGVDARGLELSHANVNLCAAKGLAVIQGDAEADLEDYADAAFDYVVMSDTLQSTMDPRGVLSDLTRIGRKAIVAFANFGHWRMLTKRVLTGRSPRNADYPEMWWETPVVRPFTVLDFRDLLAAMALREERAVAVDPGRGVRPMRSGPLANLMTRRAIFVVSRD